MATVDLLFPVNTPHTGFDPAAMLTSITSGLTYNVSGYSTIVTQIDTPIDAALAGTITLQCSLNGNFFYDLPAGAVTYTATGVQQVVNVEGIRFVRYQITTTSGTVECNLTVTGIM